MYVAILKDVRIQFKLEAGLQISMSNNGYTYSSYVAT